MARTLTQIRNELLAAKAAEPKLDALDSPSNFAIWRLWLYVVAMAVWTLEQLFDRHKAEVEARLAQNIFGSAEWFVLQMKKFQYGENLVRYENGALGYSQVSPEKQIITQAAISVASGSDNVATLKVAKTVDGQPAQLSASELAAARGYIDRLQPPGAYILVNSLPGDTIKLSLEVYYNPLLEATSLKTSIETAIDQHLSNLPFNGKILRSKIVDAVQAVAGVEDVVITLFEAKASGETYAPVDRVYIPKSGYVKIDVEHPLKDHLTLKTPL
ncbi:baseplate J/gp47 family protein [uncultured Microscilla sp.]|uniref:baseplate J/gp47 family protein n=1 Tax=uncultured Microscilla sp. TaxID=432653 RepID=UPI002613D77C|nr:baseplate J/gp47 family protein [uncultured Microscilla sp.]